MTRGICFDCFKKKGGVGVVIPCCGCGEVFCHTDFEFHDCVATRQTIGRVQAILDRGAEERQHGEES